MNVLLLPAPAAAPTLSSSRPQLALLPRMTSSSSPSFTTPSDRWRALVTRAPSAHSAFVYAVLTTRIYCRPTCPGRLARRANVCFYDSAHQAVAAGFRACKRCRPELDGASAADELRNNTGNKAAAGARAVLDRERGAVVWRDVAAEVGLTPRYLHEAFKNAFGLTPGAYAAVLKEKEEEEENKSGAGLVQDSADDRPPSGAGVGAGENGGGELEGIDAGLRLAPQLSGDALVSNGDDSPAVADIETTPDSLNFGSWEDFVLWEPVTFTPGPVEREEGVI